MQCCIFQANYRALIHTSNGLKKDEHHFLLTNKNEGFMQQITPTGYQLKDKQEKKIV